MAAVMSDALALEMAQPLPWNDTSLIWSPSTLSQMVSWSPHSGFFPSACALASSITRKLRGRRLWSRMMLWYRSSSSADTRRSLDRLRRDEALEQQRLQRHLERLEFDELQHFGRKGIGQQGTRPLRADAAALHVEQRHLVQPPDGRAVRAL